MKYIKNIKLLTLVGLLLQVGIGFAYRSDGQAILGALDRFDRVPVSKLTEVAEKGSLQDLKSALNSHKATINEVDKYETTALMYAVKRGRKDIVELLVDNGADPHIITWNDKTALREAVKEGYKEIIRLLLDINSEFRKRSIECALVEAAQKGHKDIVSLLLDKGANPSSTAINNDPRCTPTDTTALIEATQAGHKDIVKLLLDKGANPNIKDVHGNTALQIAERKGYKEIVQLIKR